MKRRAAVLLLSVALAAGCRGGSGDQLPSVSGGSEAQREVMGEVLADVEPASLRTVRIVRVQGGVKLGVEPRAGRSIRGEWEGTLIAGIFAARSAHAGLPVVVALQTPSGTSNLRHESPRRLPPASVRDRRRLRDTLDGLVSASGAEVVELRVDAPDGALMAVLVLRTRRPAGFLARGLPSVLAPLEIRSFARFEGTFVRVEDQAGPVWERAWANRVGGSFWGYVRPGLAGCDPEPLEGPVRPPPCPA